MSVSSTKIHILTQRPNVSDLSGVIPYVEGHTDGDTVTLVHDETYSMGLESPSTEIYVCKFKGKRRDYFARISVNSDSGDIFTVEISG